MPSPAITLIAALDSKRAIGQDNALPWHIPQDLQRFKALTRGKPLIMGRKTAESLGRALPHRANIVLSRSNASPFEGMVVAPTVDQALALAGSAPEVMIVGGGQVYELFLPRAQVLRLTWVDTQVERPDAYFPELEPGQWVETFREEHSPSVGQPLRFRFVDYRRIG